MRDGLVLDLQALLGFYGLVQSIAPPPPWHSPPCEFVYYDDLYHKPLLNPLVAAPFWLAAISLLPVQFASLESIIASSAIAIWIHVASSLEALD